MDPPASAASLLPVRGARRFTLSCPLFPGYCEFVKKKIQTALVPPGVLKQLSDKYPNITFKITNEATKEVLRCRGGKFVD
jgi:hypothetical protein